MPRGDCYEAAGRFLMDRGMAGAADGLTLCHGLVWGRGPIAGKLIGHAWIEECLEENIQTNLKAIRSAGWQGNESAMLAEARKMATCVCDYANGRDLIVPASLYYAIGSIEHVVRYTWNEARKLMAGTGHWGHWELPDEWNGIEVH